MGIIISRILSTYGCLYETTSFSIPTRTSSHIPSTSWGPQKHSNQNNVYSNSGGGRLDVVWENPTNKSPMKRKENDLNKTSMITLQGINVSHLGKRKIIFKRALVGDMLVSRRVYSMLIFRGEWFLFPFFSSLRSSSWTTSGSMLVSWSLANHYGVTPGSKGDLCSSFTSDQDRTVETSTGTIIQSVVYLHIYIYIYLVSVQNTTTSAEVTLKWWFKLLAGGGFKYFLFSPRSLGFHDPIGQILFQMGWFNHQLEHHWKYIPFRSSL